MLHKSDQTIQKLLLLQSELSNLAFGASETVILMLFEVNFESPLHLGIAEMISGSHHTL